jgi:hypothetical protein
MKKDIPSSNKEVKEVKVEAQVEEVKETKTDKAVEEVKPEKKKRVPTEKQLAGLHKGMEALKQKRIQIAAEKEERERRRAAGEVIAEPIRLRKKQLVDLPKIEIVEPPAPKVRKQRSDIGKKRGAIKPPLITREEFEALQLRIVEAFPKEKVVEKIVEKPVEKVVERVVEKKVSGSEMLNKIFNLR